MFFYFAFLISLFNSFVIFYIWVQDVFLKTISDIKCIYAPLAAVATESHDPYRSG